MSDPIDRQAAIDKIGRFIGYIDEDMINRIRIGLKRLPSAQPDIIRCKDCKHYDDRPCGIVDWYNTADDFCSRAERKNNV